MCQQLCTLVKSFSYTINVQGYNREKEYIATQGPLPDTVGDFWRLIWDYNIPSVVMLTNIVEKMKVKCNQYWPDDGSQQYAHINVTIINTVHQADFIIRHFQIKAVSSREIERREGRKEEREEWRRKGEGELGRKGEMREGGRERERWKGRER